MIRLGFAVGGLVLGACSDPSGLDGGVAQTGSTLGPVVDEGFGCQMFFNGRELTIRCRQDRSDWGHPVFGEARVNRVVAAQCQPALDNAHTCSMTVPVDKPAGIYGTIGWQRTYRHFRVDSSSGVPSKLVFTKVAMEPTHEARSGCFRSATRSQAGLWLSGLSQAERASIPFFECFRGGPGLWTIVVKQIERRPCDAGSCLWVELEVVGVTMAGAEVDLGSTVGMLLPGTNRLRWEVLDVDGDGLDDFGFTLSAGDSVLGSSLSHMTSSARGSIQVPWPFHYWRRVDSDVLPDLETFGPYSRNLFDNCGLTHCPSLVHGPELLGHNTPFGFNFGDAAAYEYLASGCEDGLKLGETRFQQLARMVVCSRLLRTDQRQVEKELVLGRRTECIKRDNCLAFDVLNEWLEQAVPSELETLADWAGQCRTSLL